MSNIWRLGDSATRRAFAVTLAIVGCGTPARTTAVAPVSDSAAIVADVTYLASPALAGRLIGTRGNDSAAAYIARRYQALGLQALAARYKQPFVAHPPVREGPRPDIPAQN